MGGGGPHDRGQHRQDDGEVGPVHVGPDHAGLLAPDDQVPDRPGDQVVQLVFEPLGAVGVAEHFDETAVGCQQLKRLVEELGQARHRVFDSRRLLGHRDGAVEGLLEVRPGELVLVGEVPVGGGDVHPGVPGDVIKGGVEPLRGEDLLGGVDEPLPVAGGVGPQSARLGPPLSVPRPALPSWGFGRFYSSASADGIFVYSWCPQCRNKEHVSGKQANALLGRVRLGSH